MRVVILLSATILVVWSQKSTEKPRLDRRADPCKVCITITEHARKIHIDEDPETAVYRTVEVGKYIAEFNQKIWQIIMQQYWDPIYQRVNGGQSPIDICTQLRICHSDKKEEQELNRREPAF